MISIAFRKVKSTWNPISRLIGLTGPYCHCEFVFPTKPRTWFGAVLSGLRFTQDITGNPKKWEFVEVDWDEEMVWKLCEMYEGRNYDILGLFSFALPFVKQDPRRFYCSEIIYKVGVMLGKLEPGETKVHPSKLYILLHPSPKGQC